MIQQVIHNKLVENKIDRNVASIITQVLVDNKDTEFKNPTKRGVAMNEPIKVDKTSVETTPCPYCEEVVSVDLPGDYRPVYAYCGLCGKKFIVERLSEGFHALKIEEATCLSDPEWRDIEFAAGDEE